MKNGENDKKYLLSHLVINGLTSVIAIHAKDSSRKNVTNLNFRKLIPKSQGGASEEKAAVNNPGHILTDKNNLKDD